MCEKGRLLLRKFFKPRDSTKNDQSELKGISQVKFCFWENSVKTWDEARNALWEGRKRKLSTRKNDFNLMFNGFYLFF